MLILSTDLHKQEVKILSTKLISEGKALQSSGGKEQTRRMMQQIAQTG
jgi:hypothetical protein